MSTSIVITFFILPPVIAESIRSIKYPFYAPLANLDAIRHSNEKIRSYIYR